MKRALAEFGLVVALVSVLLMRARRGAITSNR